MIAKLKENEMEYIVWNAYKPVVPRVFTSEVRMNAFFREELGLPPAGDLMASPQLYAYEVQTLASNAGWRWKLID